MFFMISVLTTYVLCLFAGFLKINAPGMGNSLFKKSSGFRPGEGGGWSGLELTDTFMVTSLQFMILPQLCSCAEIITNFLYEF